MMNRPTATTRALAAMAALAVIVGACSRDADSTTGPTTTSPAASSAAPSSSAPSTTEPPATTTSIASTTTSTTVASTSTTVVATTTTEPQFTAADLTLSSDGVLPFMFGIADGEVLEGLTAVLGSPVDDRAQAYPNADGDEFLDSYQEEAYTQPLGRTVCFGNDLCAQFGGATTDTLVFTGWDLTGDTAPQLASSDGIMVGSLWADHPSLITVEQGGCYSTGYGEAVGISLILRSVGEPFVSFTEEGNFEVGTPNPVDVEVIAMRAGDLPYFLFADC